MNCRSLIFCLLFNTWNVQASWPLADSAAVHVQARLSLAEVYACSLNVWNKEVKPGAHDVKLTTFHLRVEAYMITRASSAEPHSNALPARGRFWLRQLELQYAPNWRTDSTFSPGDHLNARLDWNQLRIQTSDGRDPIPIQQLTVQDTLARIDIYSGMTMSRNDLMRIGVFYFQAEAPGVYELRFQLKGKGRPAFEARHRIEFTCTLMKPQIALIKDGTLHEVRNTSIHIPLIASTFFEAQSPQPNRNETDRVFRTMFLGFMSRRLACTELPVSLLMLDDLTSNVDASTRAEQVQQRADYLLQALAGNSHAQQTGSPCVNLPTPNDHAARPHADDPACRNQIAARLPTPAEVQYYLKTNESEVSPLWFAEENRVVPLVAAPEVQRLIFEPIKITPREESDYVGFRYSNPIPEAMLKCVRSGAIEVMNVQGETCRQEIAAGDLPRVLRDGSSLWLNSPQMNAFLTAGEFAAVLKLAIFSSPEVLESDTVRFRVARKQIVRDEVFALSPYDRVDLSYELDRERVARIGREVLKAAQDPAPVTSPGILVLITGHSDSLGEHRAQGVGRHYNLGLSFGRALYLRKIFTDSVMWHATRSGFTIRMTGQQLLIPAALHESVRKHLGRVIEPGSKGSNGTAGTNGQENSLMEEYLNLLIHEKARHFRVETENLSFAPIPSAEEIIARCESLRPLLPLEIVTLEISAHGRKMVIRTVAIGFGAAVPFYRELRVSEELREVFCKMDYRAEEMPAYLFGRDRYPAGRLMNRRVEVNVIW